MRALFVPARSAWQWAGARPYTTAGVVTMAVLSVFFLTRKDYEWESVFLSAAARLWAGEDIYRPGEAYLYPPFMAWATLPFLGLPEVWRRPAWLAVNLVCLVAVLRCSWQVAGGRRLQGGDAPRHEHLAALAGLACGASYLLNCWSHLQTDIVIAAFQAVGCLLLLRGRAFSAAGFFGLAAACKCTPLLWAPYLVWRRRPLAAALVLAVAVGVNLLPNFVSQPGPGRTWLGDFAVRYLEPLTRRDHVAGSWGSDIVYNQSIAGAGQRWLATTWHWGEADCTVTHDPAGPPPLLLRGLVYGSCLAVLLFSLVACGRPLRASAEGEVVAGGVPRLAVECGVIVLLMVLLSPMSSKAHFGLLVLPGFCLARASRCRGILWRAVLVGALVLALVGNKDLLGGRLYTLALWYGAATWETVLLLVGCWVLLWERRDTPGGRALPAPLRRLIFSGTRSPRPLAP